MLLAIVALMSPLASDGDGSSRWTSIAIAAASLGGLIVAGLWLFGLRFLPHPAWYAAVAIVFGLLQVQLWRIRDRDPQACFRAFLSNHWVGFTIWMGIVGALWLR